MLENYRKNYQENGWYIFPTNPRSKEPRVAWTRAFRGEWRPDDGIGVGLGSRSNGLVDVDLDWPEAADAARSVFGSGRTMAFGRAGKRFSHFVFKSDNAKTMKFKLPKSFMELDVPDEHALTVCEIRSSGAYTVFPPSIHVTGEEVAFENDCDPQRVEADWLIEKVGFIAFLAVCFRFWPGDGARHDAALHFAGIMKWAGVPEATTLAIIEAVAGEMGDRDKGDRLRAVSDTYAADGETTKWAAFLETFSFPADARPTFAKWLGLNTASAVAEYNDRYAVIRDGSKVRIGTATIDPVYQRKRWDLMSETDFLLLERKSEDAKKWLVSPDRRQYDNGFIFDPTGQNHAGYLNLWEGWAVQPKPGRWSLIRQHIYDVLAGGNAEHGIYIERWIAWALKNPDKPAEVAVVFRGGKGVGKGMLGRALCRIAGQHGLHVSSSSQMTGRFNSHMRDCVFLFADEAFWAGDKEGEGQLKRMITENTLTIEGKGRDVIVAPNLLHIMVASNEDWVVPATRDERRFAMFDVPDDRVGDDAYFRALAAEIDGDGLAAMTHDLMAMDLGDWHPRQQIPRTVALHSQMGLSEDPIRSLFREFLATGQLPGLREGDHAPNELLVDEMMKQLEHRAFGRNVKRAAVGLFLKTIPGVKRDNNGRIHDRYDPVAHATAYRRGVRYHMPPLDKVRNWFDPLEAWDSADDWNYCEFEDPHDAVDAPF